MSDQKLANNNSIPTSSAWLVKLGEEARLDGNGRLGRLWQSLILGQQHEAFLVLPVESMVHDNQQACYDAINESTKKADCKAFIDFMLTEICEALKVYQREKAPNGVVSGAVIGAVNQIVAHIKANPGSRSNAIADALNIPLRSVQRYLTRLKSENKIEFRGAPENGGYFWKAGSSGMKNECDKHSYYEQSGQSGTCNS